ncbi:MAG: hypothetical protein ABI895_42130, partial [Deltaproteobacteria bacterium]
MRHSDGSSGAPRLAWRGASRPPVRGRDGVRTFYREAGPADAPILLLPHGYPCSSFQYRRLMPA